MNNVKYVLIWIGALVLTVWIMSKAAEAREQTENWYVKEICSGIIEYRLLDKTRVDCLTETRAWEYDFADKWYEAIGQSLWYAANTGRKAGVMLILEKESQIKYVFRAIKLVEHYGLPIEVRYWDARNPK